MASSLENETFSLPTAFFSSLIAALVSIIPHMVDRQAGDPPAEKWRPSCHIRIAKRQNKAEQGATKGRGEEGKGGGFFLTAPAPRSGGATPVCKVMTLCILYQLSFKT